MPVIDANGSPSAMTRRNALRSASSSPPPLVVPIRRAPLFKCHARRGRPPRLHWTSEMIGTMLDSLIEWKTGSDCESSAAFHHGAWTEAVDRVQELTNTTVSKKMLQCKYRGLRKEWDDWCRFEDDVLGKEGWLWDEATYTYVQRDEQAADDYWRCHTKWMNFRYRGLQFKDRLSQVVGNSSLSSDHGKTADDTDQRLARKRPAPPGQAERKRLMTEARLRHRGGGERTLAEKISIAAKPWYSAVRVMRARLVFAVRSNIEKEQQDGAIRAFDEAVSVVTRLFLGGLWLGFIERWTLENFENLAVHLGVFAGFFSTVCRTIQERPAPKRSFVGEAVAFLGKHELDVLPRSWIKHNGELRNSKACHVWRALIKDKRLSKTCVVMEEAGVDIELRRRYFLVYVNAKGLLSREDLDKELQAMDIGH